MAKPSSLAIAPRKHSPSVCQSQAVAVTRGYGYNFDLRASLFAMTSVLVIFGLLSTDQILIRKYDLMWLSDDPVLFLSSKAETSRDPFTPRVNISVLCKAKRVCVPTDHLNHSRIIIKFDDLGLFKVLSVSLLLP